MPHEPLSVTTGSTDVPLGRVVRVAAALCLLIVIPCLLALSFHRSRDATVLGRYSWSYFAFILAYAGCAGVLGVLLRQADVTWNRIQAAIRQWSGRGSLRWWWTIVPAIVVVLLATLGFMQRWAPGRSMAGQLGVVALAVWLTVVVTGLLGSRVLLNRLGNVILFGVTGAVVLGLGEMTVRTWPQLIPEPVMQWLPGGGRYLRRADFVEDLPIRVGYRFAPMQDRWVGLDPFDPGIGRVQGITGPYSATPPDPLPLRFVTDEDGFLNTPPVTGRRFDVVVVGDSFMGPTAEVHWTDLIASSTGRSVLQLGNSGWGTQAELEALKLFGLPKSPQWVVLAYFGGNDLWDAARYEQKKASGLSWIEDDVVSVSFLRSLVIPQLFRYYAWLAANYLRPPDYLYPIDVKVANRDLRLELSQQYVGVLSASAEQIEKSRNFALVQTSVLRARAASEAAGAHFVLVYIPAEPQVYLRYVTEHDQLRIAARAPSVKLGDDGYLRFTPDPPAPTALLRHANDQADLLRSLALKHEIDFIDLTTAFVNAAERGVGLYNYADTHWNAAGHTLAAEVVASHLGRVSHDSANQFR